MFCFLKWKKKQRNKQRGVFRNFEGFLWVKTILVTKPYVDNFAFIYNFIVMNILQYIFDIKELVKNYRKTRFSRKNAEMDETFFIPSFDEVLQKVY